MTAKDLERLYNYGYWANRKLFLVAAELTPEQFTQNVAGSYGSIRNTFVHMLSAEWGWLDRCGGAKRGPALKPEEFPTLDSVMNLWATVEGHVRVFLAGLTDRDMDRTIEFANPHGEKRSGTLGALMQHGANHGVHHRGQVALLLRALGQAPGNVDLLIYDAEQRGVMAF